MTESTTVKQLESILEKTRHASRLFSATSPQDRAKVLKAIAGALDDAADELVPTGMRETNLPEPRLRGELKRTTFQLRLFAEVIEDGACFDPRIDHADPDWPMGAPRPDLRRVQQAIGPVLVFAASNFPFAFSVAGGDTASALAAGNAVVVKAHSGHIELSKKTAEVVQHALQQAGAPEGLFSLIIGQEAGIAAIKHPVIKAAGFTGGIPGGVALFKLACNRPDPIPFYGELGSNNPVFVLPGAAEHEADEIVKGFTESFTLGAGQFCTKPGTIAVPVGSALLEQLKKLSPSSVHPMLNERIEQGFLETLASLTGHSEVSVIAGGNNANEPTVLLTTAAAVLADPEVLHQECFGPASLVVTYENEQQLLKLAGSFEGQLTTTIFADEEESSSSVMVDLVEVCARISGRVLYNQWPTGVSVTYSQQHGGPFPASTAVGTTSVGTAAIERFLRPVAFQNFPQDLLPESLRDGADQRQLIDGSFNR